MNRDGVLVCGYYGFANVGDEAVLAGMAHALREAGFHAPIRVLSASPIQTQAEHSVEAVPRSSLPMMWRALRCSRLFVLGGGSLLQDITSARSIVYYLGVHWLARRAGCRVAWIGQGIGPLRRAWARWWTARAARQAEAIVVRDPESASLLRAWQAAHVQEGADLSFLLSAPEKEKGWARLTELGATSDEALLAIAPRRWAHMGEEETVVLFTDVAQYAQRHLGARPLLLAMHPARDGRLLETIAARVPEVFAFGEPLSVREVRNVLACCQAVIGVRLHALMLASASGVPALAISYDPKVRSFWSQVMPEYVIDTAELDGQTLKRRLTALWEHRENLQECVAQFAQQQQQKARVNIDAVLALGS